MNNLTLKFNSALVLLTLCSLAFSQTELQKKLDFGKYKVGFKRTVVIDSTRTNNYIDQGNHRPVIINMWYPAKSNNSEKIPFNRYITFDEDGLNPELSKLLNHYNKKQTIKYAFEKRINIPNSSVYKAFRTLKKMKTNSVEDAEAVEETFPLIVYHQGSGAAIADNYLFLEYLASHGYVVCNAAYQYNKKKKWPGVGWDLNSSILDMDIVIETALKNSFVDDTSLGMIGHSIGGDLALDYVAKGKYTPDAIITLDSHFGYCDDYVGIGIASESLKVFWENLEKYDVPMLNTGALAYFPVMDSLIYCSRTYLEICNLSHEDYTSIRVIGRRLIKSNNRKSIDVETVEENHAALVRYCHQYFNNFLKYDEKDKISDEPLMPNLPFPKNQFSILYRKKGENPTSTDKRNFILDTALLRTFIGTHQVQIGRQVHRCKLYIKDGQLLRAGLTRYSDYFWTPRSPTTLTFTFHSDIDYRFNKWIWGRMVYDKEGNYDGFIINYWDKNGNVAEAFNKKID